MTVALHRPRVITALASAGNGGSAALRLAQVSQRVLATDAPCIGVSKALMARKPGALSLAQGIVHWRPPPRALEEAAQLLASDPSIHGYGLDEGLPELREALQEKLAGVNGLPGHRVMVTAGANQAFTNLVLTLVDEGDQVVLFAPYYFNHLMAVQMTGGARGVLKGPCDPATLHPDLDWLEGVMRGPSPPKMVVLVSPCNPTGVLLPREELQRASDLCAAAGAYLVLDNTYEQFVYGGRTHAVVSGAHVVHVFSFSKGYGMMGWRVGYIAYADPDGSDALGAQLLKVQDTIAVCASQLSQRVALAALRHGGGYVAANVEALAPNRAALEAALAPLARAGAPVSGGEGAIYFFAGLPEGAEDDEAVMEWLVMEHGVCVIPGSACGAPGHIRVAFANLQPADCAEASARLHAGLEALAARGPDALRGYGARGR